MLIESYILGIASGIVLLVLMMLAGACMLAIGMGLHKLERWLFPG